MKTPYKQLTLDDREQLFIHKVNGLSIRQIAQKLGKSHSSISREIKRNSSDRTRDLYQPYVAHDHYRKRKFRPSVLKLESNWKLRWYVRTRLQWHWSPEIISGRLPLEHPDLSISHESIYRYIYARDLSLITFLPRRHTKRRKKTYPRSPRALPIPNRIFIDQRPDLINQRSQFGHWEADSMVSRQNTTAFHVLLERQSRFIKISKIPANNSSLVSSAIISKLQDHPSFVRKSITYDNGSENVLHSKINQSLNAQSFFCNPYHSWEKGSVENVIGLIRRFVPKKSDLQKVPSSDVTMIEHLLNSRPRKCLDFKTPNEIFTHSLSGALET